MRQFFLVVLIAAILGCSCSSIPKPDDQRERQYSAAAISLPDFAMKITAYYEAQKLPIPKDFDARQFFDVLESAYPDRVRVKQIKDNFKVSVRSLDGGYYSVMLCDPETDAKVMEDISCHLNRVEVQSWQNQTRSPCVFESNWRQYCE